VPASQGAALPGTSLPRRLAILALRRGLLLAVACSAFVRQCDALPFCLLLQAFGLGRDKAALDSRIDVNTAASYCAPSLLNSDFHRPTDLPSCLDYQVEIA